MFIFSGWVCSNFSYQYLVANQPILGFPIVQDPLYTKDGEKIQKQKFDTLNIQRYAENVPAVNTTTTTGTSTENNTELPPINSTSKSEVSGSSEPTPDTTPEELQELMQDCPDCKVRWIDPEEQDLFLFLHAYSYETPQWKFTTKLPAWAELFNISEDKVNFS